MNPMQLVLAIGAWGESHRWYLFWAMGGLFLLALVAGVLGRKRQAAATTHGSARWARPREVRQAGLLASQGVVVGRYRGRLLLDDSERHGLLCAPTGSGKGVGPILGTLLAVRRGRHVQAAWPESALVLDPKDGENAEVSAKGRQALGLVALFTPCRSPQTRINVRDFIRLKTPHEYGDALVVGQSLTAPEKLVRESETSRHFRELAALLLAAGLLHIAYTQTYASLAALWHFLTQQHATLQASLKTMRLTVHWPGAGVHQAILALTRAIENISGDRELSSVWTTAIRPLAPYADPYIAASTDSSTLALEDLQYGADPVSLYLIAPSPAALERLHPVYRVILDVLLARLMEHKPRTFRHRLLIVADELPGYGYVRAIDRGIPVIRDYGMKALLVTQDLGQLEEVYGERSALWGNTQLKIFHAPAHDQTAKRISESFMGRGTIVNPVEQRQAGLLGRQSVSVQHVGRALLMPDEVMELDPRQQIVRVTGVKPILCAKVNYLVDPEFQGRVV
jgi:type IV secretion system protein VirD4